MRNADRPRFLRFAQSLVLTGTALAAGCASAVGPADADDSSADVAANDSEVSDGSVCASPGPAGAPCAPTGTMCGNSCGAWHCQTGSDGGAQWVQLFCGGPCRPPELAAS